MVTLAIALSSGKLAFTAELLSLSNLKAELPKKKKRFKTQTFLPGGLKQSCSNPERDLFSDLDVLGSQKLTPNIQPKQNKTKNN